jgi:hypothetical protein
MFFVVNVHTRWGALLHSMMEFFRIDKGHPYTYSYTSIRRFLADNRFIIQYEEVEDYGQIKKNNCRSKILKDKIKGYSGISEILYTCICLKAPAKHA